MASSGDPSTSTSSHDVGAESAGADPAPTGFPDEKPPDETPEDEQTANPAAQAFHRIAQNAAELKEYAGYYVGAKIDGYKRAIRNLGLYAALAILALIAGGAILATASGLIVVGFATGLGRLFGGRMWLGDIVAGVVVMAGIAGVVWLMMNKLTGSWQSRTMKKYEERKQSQRERFGRAVDDRAAQGKAHGPKKDE